MNFEIIAEIILAVSFLGIIGIVFRKIPHIKDLPHKEDFLRTKKIKEKIKETTIEYWTEKMGEVKIFLQKFLLKTRVLFMKADNRAVALLHKLTETPEKSKTTVDDYWKGLKTSIASAKIKTRRRKVKSQEQELQKETEEEIKEEEKEI
ncbi:MAG: hypothetical protein WC303_02670 [Candidatus Paceibacterota bacterium]|jgi:hypothetical protein